MVALEEARYEFSELVVTPKPEVLPIGSGYEVRFRLLGVALRITRLDESHGEVKGMLVVKTDIGTAAIVDGHLYAGTFNLSSLTARKTMAAHLQSRCRDVAWIEVLERFCVSVLTERRKGSPVESLGRDPITAPSFVLGPNMPAPTDEITLLIGGYGALKSTLARAALVTLTTGVEVIPGWRPTQRMKCLVLEYEQRNSQPFNNAIAKIAAGAGIEAPLIDRRWCSRPLVEEDEEIAELRAAGGYEVFLLDSVGPAIGNGREGSGFNERALDLFRSIRTIGGTWLLIDQTTGDENKSNRPVYKAIDGIQKMYQSRAAYWIGKERDREGGEVDLSVKQVKLTEGRPMAPFGLAVSFADDAIRFRRKDIDSRELLAGLPPAARIRALLKAGALPAKEIAEELDIPESSVRTYLTRELKGDVQRLEDKRWGLSA